MKCDHCGKVTDDERLELYDGRVFCCGTCMVSYDIEHRDDEPVEELSFL